VQKQVLGADHPDTLTAASDRQQYLSRHGKHAKEEGLKGARGTEGQAGAKEEEPEAPVAQREQRARCKPRRSGQQRARAHALTRPNGGSSSAKFPPPPPPPRSLC